MKTLSLLFLLALSLSISAQLSGTYLIDDAGSGDYNSMSAAVADLNSQGINGPVTFEFVSGSGPYNEQVSITAGGTSAWPILFKGNAVQIEFLPTLPDPYVIRVDNADHITFLQLNVRVLPGATIAWGYHIFGESDYITVDDCKIRAPGSTFDTAPAGINANGVADQLATAYLNPVGPDFLTVTNCRFIGGATAIAIAGGPAGSYSEGIVIKGNDFENVYSWGMRIFQVKNSIINANNIEMREYAGANGEAIYISLCSDQIEISKNRIYHPAASAIHCQSMATTETLVVNNFVGGTNQVGGGSSIYLNDCSNLKLWHNTLHKSVGYGAALVIKDLSTVDVRNNCIVNTDEDGSCLDIEYPGSLTAIDYNNYFTFGGFLVRKWGSTSFFYDLGQLQTSPIGPVGHNANSLDLNPNFESVLNPHLLYNSLDGKATAGLVAKDIDGENRPATPDMGADEYTNPGDDASPIELVSPQSGDPGVYPIQVAVQNLGTNLLSTVQVYASIDDGSSIVNLGPIGYSGAPIAFESTGLLDFGSYNFVDGEYDITVYTESPNGVIDTVDFNDTLYQFVGISFPLNGDYTIDQTAPTSNSNFTSIQSAIDKAAFYGIAGKTTFSVVPGSGPYNEQFVIPHIPGASASRILTLKGRGETVEYTITSSELGYIAKFDSASYVSLEDFVINDGNSPIESWLVMVSRASHDISIRGNILNQKNTFIDFPPITANDYTSIGIGDRVGAYVPSSGYNILIEENTINGGYRGICTFGDNFFSELDPAHDITIKNNNITDYFSYGIELWNCNDAVIAANTIERRILELSDATAIRYRNSEGGVVISNDIVSTRKGMEFVGNNLSSGTTTLVANNMCAVENTSPFFNTESLELRATFGIKLYSNSFLATGPGVTSILKLEVDPTAGISIAGNSFVTMTAAGGNAVRWNGVNVDEWKSNNFYAASGDLVYLGGTGVVATDLASLNAVFGGTGAMVNDPLHVSTSDLHLQSGSPLIDQYSVVEMAYDFDGGTRPGGGSVLADIGADEFGSGCDVPANPFSDNITTTMASLHWDAMPAAVGYVLQGREAPSGSPRTIQLSSNNVTFNVFEPGKTYQWRVQSVCSYRSSAFTAPQSFTMMTLRNGETAAELDGFHGMTVSPNPASDLTTVTFDLLETGVVNWQLFDVNGKLLRSDKQVFVQGKNTLEIGLLGLGIGIYELRLQGAMGSRVHRLAVQ